MCGWNGILSFIIKNNPSLKYNKVIGIRNGEKNHYHQFQIKFLLTLYGYFFMPNNSNLDFHGLCSGTSLSIP